MPETPGGSPPSPDARRILRGRYRLEHVLAVGGLAEVWVGSDLLLGRSVAVKVLRPALANQPAVVARFRTEAVAAARVRHPNVVGVLDTVADPGDEAVVMELVPGQSLRHVLDDRGRLGLAEVVRVGSSLADALDAVHRAGLVHRDVKPGNVLLASDGRVLLADFGLARITRLDDPHHGSRTIVGTPKYVSPEQVRGLPVDGRTDLYALGVVLYECAAGRPPFDGTDDLAVALARLDREPPPLRSVRPATPKALSDLVARLLARDPTRRPPDTASVRAELARLGPMPDDGDAQPAADAPRRDVLEVRDPAPAPPRRRRGVVAGALVAGLLVGAGMWAVTGSGARPTLERATGERPASAAQPASTAAAAGSSSSAAPPVKVEIGGTGEYDPPPAGDGREHPELLGLLTDGDPATQWTSLCYRQATFAPKQGVGVVVELSADAAGHHLVVTTPMTGWSAQIRVALQPGQSLVEWGRVVSQGTDLGPGAQTFDLGTAPGRYVLVLVTEAPAGPTCRDGGHQARIGELAVVG